MWNKEMSLEQLQNYARWILNTMENTLDDYYYNELEELLFSVNSDIKQLEEQQ